MSKPAVKSFSKGEFLLHQNEASRHMFVINSGTVKVFRKEGGFITYSNDIGPGSIVGELALIDGGPRSASAIALEDVEASVIFLEDLEVANKKCPPWLRALARTLTVRTRNVLGNIERDPDKFVESSIVSLLIYFSVAEEDKLVFNKSNFIDECMNILRLPSSKIIECLENLELESQLRITDTEIIIGNLDSLEVYKEQLRSTLEQNHLSIFKP